MKSICRDSDLPRRLLKTIWICTQCTVMMQATCCHSFDMSEEALLRPSGSRQCCFFFGAKPNTTKKEAQKSHFKWKNRKWRLKLSKAIVRMTFHFFISLDQESSQEYHFTNLSFAHQWRSTRRPEIKDWRWERRNKKKIHQKIFFFRKNHKVFKCDYETLVQHQNSFELE
jgi:hypothetical protein